MKKRLIPFRLLPGSWGLVGQIYREAEAAYYYEGEELEYRLIDIRFPEGEAKTRAIADVKLRHGKITPYQHDLELLTLEYPDVESLDYKLTKLAIEHHHKNISDFDYEKETANLKGEPWIRILDDSFDPSRGPKAWSIQFDWNPQMIKFLRDNNYRGATDDDVIEQWLEDLWSGPSQYHNVEPFDPI